MERSGEVTEIVMLILGLLIFGFAMWWDGKTRGASPGATIPPSGCI